MKKGINYLLSFIIRYLLLIVFAFPNFWLFYFIFTPLTLYPVYFLLNFFFEPSLIGNSVILVNNSPIELIGACIAGSAYYLLLIFNLAIPKINPVKRIKMILFSFTLLLILNILRIFLLSLMFIAGSSIFDITHKVFWYVGSIVFVVGIWFLEVKLFKIKEIPFYSDIKSLYKKSNLKK
ncbi:pacearchaeosortase [Candidatus Pacearchaeota archaeon]|nr:pacearchaeosortase [Candidatus Pacearchaeota archaeon]